MRVFLEPAVQDIGVHALAASQCRYGSTGLLAGGNQMGFEFGTVASVGAPGRTSAYLYFFEHGVHDGLCAHDLAGLEVSIQDGIAGRLPSIRNR